MEAADRALLTAVTVDRSVAGRVVRLTIDRAVAPRLAAPFLDLPPCPGSSEPDLEIRIDPLDQDEALRLGLSELQASGTLESSADGRYVHHRQTHCVSRLDRLRRTIHARVRAGGEPAGFAARPLQPLLSIACADRDVDLVHAALVSRRGQGVLIAGVSGAGKSTVAIAALLDGWEYFGDDCVAVERRAAGFAGSRVYASACLDPRHLASFAPQLSADPAAPGEKSVVPVPSRGPQTVDATIRALVLPRVCGGDEVVLVPVDAKAALLALAPTSILRRAVPAAAMLARLRRLAAAVPCYALEMGPPHRIAARLRTLVDQRD